MRRWRLSRLGVGLLLVGCLATSAVMAAPRVRWQGQPRAVEAAE